MGGENWRKRRVFFSLHFHFSSGKPRSERLSICSKLSLLYAVAFPGLMTKRCTFVGVWLILAQNVNDITNMRA